jgi:hypothetical protein
LRFDLARIAPKLAAPIIGGDKRPDRAACVGGYRRRAAAAFAGEFEAT